MTASNNNIDDLILNMSLTELRSMAHNSEPVSVVYKNHISLDDEYDDCSELDERILNMSTSELRNLKIEHPTDLNLHDSVALLTDLPQKQLKKGQVGTITDVGLVNIFEVKFINPIGQTLAFAYVKATDLLKLDYVLQSV
jgi:hypothetical protein